MERSRYKVMMPKHRELGEEEVEGDIATLLGEAYTRGIHNGARQEKGEPWTSWLPRERDVEAMPSAK